MDHIQPEEHRAPTLYRTATQSVRHIIGPCAFHGNSLAMIFLFVMLSIQDPMCFLGLLKPYIYVCVYRNLFLISLRKHVEIIFYL